MAAKPKCKFKNKMRIVDLSAAQSRKALQAAFVEYHRSWVRFDGPMVRHIQCNLNGKIDEQTIQMIASNYGVSRSFSLGKPGDPKNRDLAWLRMKFNRRQWQSHRTLKKRSSVCADLTSDIAAEFCCNRKKASRPASFVTKVAWFLDPDDWTVFDGYAADALGVTGSNAIEQMKSYYCALDQRGYFDVVKSLRSVIEEHSNVKFPPARILDLYLWYVGADCAAREKVDILTDGYVKGLPTEWRKSIAAVKRGLAKVAASPEFLRFNDCAKCGRSE